MARKVYAALMYGQGGQPVDFVLSGGGLDRLAARIKALGVQCEVFTWDSAVTITSRIKAQAADTKIVVGGASLGANESPRVGALLKERPVDFMFGIQPSLGGVKNLVTSNVRRALYFYQPWGFAFGIGFGLGSYQWQRAPGNTRTAMLSAYSFWSHPGDNVESTQVAILAEIKKLL